MILIYWKMRKDIYVMINSLMDAADNILKTAQSGLFGLISMLAFLWIVIWLMISVRRVFNNVWQVERELKFFRMFGISLGILILSPFVILLFFSGSIVYTHVLDLAVPSRVAFSEHIKSFLAWVIYAGAAVMILSAMYKYIPGTKVHYRQALKAALIAGPVFMVLQYLYLETQVMVTRVSTVYGVLAALPLFLTYLNLGWTIVLYGAELSSDERGGRRGEKTEKEGSLMSFSVFTDEDYAAIERDYAVLKEAAARRCADEEELAVVQKAFEFANEAHKNVRRRSGEPYILHPIAVAQIVVSDIGLGYKSISAALLHDVVEDTDYTVDDLRNLFGEKIASLVDGLTKIKTVLDNEDKNKQSDI